MDTGGLIIIFRKISQNPMKQWYSDTVLYHISNISKIEGWCGRCVDVNFDSTVIEDARERCTDHCKDEKRKSGVCQEFPCGRVSHATYKRPHTKGQRTGQKYNDKVNGSSDGVSDCGGEQDIFVSSQGSPQAQAGKNLTLCMTMCVIREPH